VKAQDVVLVVGSTMRLTRLIVADDLGGWIVKYPAYRWANARDPRAETWRAKLVTGLDCPFCVGTWIGFAVLGLTGAANPSGRVGRAWRFVMAGLTLNEVTAHLGARLGDTAPED
jgi:hypothetical protein